MRFIDQIIIHCSATENGKGVSVETIDQWHAARGFRRDPALIGYNQPHLKHIGYQYVVYTSGVVTTARGLDEIGAHCSGHNAKSIGICMTGTDKFRDAQWLGLRDLVCALMVVIAGRRNRPDAPRYRLPPTESLWLAKQMGIEICGHRDLSPDADGDGTVEPHEWLKTCPGFDVASWLSGGMLPLEGHIYAPAEGVT